MHRDSVLIENYNLPHQGGRIHHLSLEIILKCPEKNDAARDVIDCVVDRLINEIVCPLIWTF